MLSKTLSASIIGIDAYIVDVEIDITSRGLPHSTADLEASADIEHHLIAEAIQ